MRAAHYPAAMSMLTPPGMGGKYRITGNRHPNLRRPRRRHRYVLASLAAVAALSVLGWGTLQLVDVFGGHSSDAATAGRKAGSGGKDRDCTADAKEPHSRSAAGNADRSPAGASALPDPGSIKVNVLNATDRAGLAKTTAQDLKKRGFKVGKVANAPAQLDKKVKGKGVVVGAPGADSTGRLKILATQLKGADRRYDERNGDDVDLVLGDHFTKLTGKKAADSALTALTGSPKTARNSSEASPSGTDCPKH